MTQRHPIQNDRTMMITMVTKNRFPFFKDDSYAREGVECLYRTQSLHPFFLYAFVIMPNHCHFLMKVPSPEKIATVIGSYKSGLLFDMQTPSIWQKRFHLQLPENPEKAREYIHMNPVRAGLCENPHEYPWSSASGKWDISPLELF
jgi:putative transposase